MFSGSTEARNGNTTSARRGAISTSTGDSVLTFWGCSAGGSSYGSWAGKSGAVTRPCPAAITGRAGGASAGKEGFNGGALAAEGGTLGRCLGAKVFRVCLRRGARRGGRLGRPIRIYG